ncbi:MAG: hypothetical protein U0T36_08970 [Saprospiraceae bacterium]
MVAWITFFIQIRFIDVALLTYLPSPNESNVYISPTTFVQIYPNHLEFRPYMPNFGYREVIVDDNCKVLTNVRYL